MKSEKIPSTLRAIGIVIGIVLMWSTTAGAQVPEDIASELRALGTGVCVPETAVLYRPLHQSAPYPGITVVRDIPYIDDERTLMDVFAPEEGDDNRPVLIFVSGGGGDNRVTGPDGDAFYDNIMLWAVENGMTGVNMQRRGGFGGGLAWDAAARDLGVLVDWVRENIADYKGDPDRIFIWASSAGNGPVSTYAAHPEISGANEESIKGVILMSAPNFNILPVTVSQGTQPSTPYPEGIGTNCGRPQVEAGGGRGRGFGRGGRGGGRGGAAEPPDGATLLARSNLAGLANGKTAVFVGWGEIDSPNVIVFDEALEDALCEAGRCPTVGIFDDHSHMSLVFAPNTDDDSVTGPILEWMRSVD
jgi:hypothetical protein